MKLDSVQAAAEAPERDRAVSWRTGAGLHGDRLLRFAVLMVLVCGRIPAAGWQAPAVSEYEVKAAFVYNFAKFVEWPAGAFATADSPLKICLLGQDRLSPFLVRMVAGKKIKGRAVDVVHLEDGRQAAACQILFVAESEQKRVPQILQGLGESSVLTVGDSDGFTGTGGIIEFIVENERVSFAINLKAAQRVHLQLSARLLTVGKLLE